VDLLHGTDFSRPIVYGRPAINTIHDLSPYADSEFFPFGKRAYKQALIPIAVRRSLAIITVSEFSRKEILERFPALEDRVFAIHHGVEPTGCMERIASDPPFLLYVGTLETRKNLVTLIRAFRLVRERRRFPHRLALVGSTGYGAHAINSAIRENGVSDSVDLLGYLSRRELFGLYRSASLLVYPSVYEGFGLPLLEAMAHGTPVVCSNAASLPEVGGDAVVYFDPHNIEDIAAAIERVLDSPSLRTELSVKGFERARLFTWEECARKHLEVYRMVLAQ
jgi:glycosyltransferase involved in cell wall biosynthesis